MAEWALPAERQLEYHAAVKRQQSDPDWPVLKQYVRGGFWRHFRAKYPESNEMYCRMLNVSGRLADAGLSGGSGARRDLVGEARTELYRGQCNCSYWHGAFGGLYLPHLRNAVYRHLIAADTLLDRAGGRAGRWVEIDAEDYNLDARKEVRLAGDRLVAWLAPARGGHLYELDIRGIRHNLLATLDRRPEPYHDVVRQAGQQRHGDGHDEKIASIHESVRFKQPDLDQRIVYDRWPRKSLVDHFLQPQLTLDQFRAGTGQVSDFETGVYQSWLRRSDNRVEAVMKREGHVGPYQVRLTKVVGLSSASGSRLDIHYELENLPPEVPLHFGIEFNFAGMAAGAPDRYYYDASGRRLGQLESVQELSSMARLGLVDEWLGLDVSLELSQAADVWTLPIETISQSEGGFELVHQSSAVVPRWHIVNPADGRWSVDIVLSVDTSAAQARELGEAPVSALAHA
jgi:4-alpha-glucanotransferase